VSGSALALRLEGDVRAAAAGDAHAFGRLVDATRTTVASIAAAILRDTELANDVAQEVYLAAWRELGKLNDATSFLPWLRQITRNRAHHALRSQVRRQQRVTTGETDGLLAAAADPHPDAMERLVAEEERAVVAAAIDALPNTTREVVILYYREGESVRHVAELLEISEAAVKQRLSRARQHLREILVTHARATAPGGAFTAAVLGALTLGAPAVAAATTVGTTAAMHAGGGTVGSGAAGTAGTVLLGGSAGALGGALLGLFGGTLGVVFGTRKLLAVARDVEERRGILATGVVGILVTLGFLVTVVIAPRPLPVTVAFGVMMVAFWVVHFRWLPAITARRKAAERMENPHTFHVREQVERRNAVLGFTLGSMLGGGAILASWFFQGS
jgi:RNA polymerase sigma factor (sigma-70 family)